MTDPISQSDLSEILIYPHIGLRKRAHPVTNVTDDHRAILSQMFAIMQAADGIGLAAPQINLGLRMIVLEMPEREDESALHYAMINPEITCFGDEIDTFEEGCLSLPGMRVSVERPVAINVSYLDEKGDKAVLDNVGGLLARCLQHEIDHLDGRLIIDHVSPLRRMRLIKAWKKSWQTDTDDQ